MLQAAPRRVEITNDPQLSDCATNGVSLYPKYRNPFERIFERAKTEGMARPEGLEPPTYSSGGWRSIQLSYGRTPMSPVYQLGWPGVAAGIWMGSGTYLERRVALSLSLAMVFFRTAAEWRSRRISSFPNSIFNTRSTPPRSTRVGKLRQTSLMP